MRPSKAELAQRVAELEQQLIIAEMVLLRFEDKAKTSLQAGYEGVRCQWIIGMVNQYFNRTASGDYADRG